MILRSAVLLTLPVLRASGGASAAAADCGMNRRLGALPAADLQLPLDASMCEGYNGSHNCCSAPMLQRLVSFIGGSVAHHAEQVKAFDGVFAPVEDLLHMLGNTEEAAQCMPVLAPFLRALRDTALSLAQHASSGHRLVEHLVMSGVCQYCLAEDPAASIRMSAQDGPAARELGMLALAMQLAQQELRALVAELLNHEMVSMCMPGYVPTLLEGVEVGIPTGVLMLDEDDRHIVVNLAVRAIARWRSWPLQRPAAGALDDVFRENFDKEFSEVTDRLLSSLLGPGARLVHQMQVFVFALEQRFLRQPEALAGLLWKDITLEASPRIMLETAAPWTIAARAALPALGLESDDVTASFGLVVLVSNHTAGPTIKGLLQRLEGPRTLFLEDTCGSALEALGYGCHSGGMEQSRCLRPRHASIAQRLVRAWPADRRPLFAWRRHTASRTVVHSARELASWYWGAGSPISLADMRSEGACTAGSSGLASIAAKLPASARVQVVKDPEGLFGVPHEPETSDEGGMGDAGSVAISWGEETFGEDVPMEVRLKDYIEFHQRGIALLHSMQGDKGRAVGLGFNVLVYSCQPFAQCGGHGDRINGIVTMFMLAVLTKRLFLLDLESPMPLQMLLTPGLIDWRVRSGILATAGLSHHSYHDKRQQFKADIGRIASYPDQLLVVSGNYRMLRSLFEAPELQPAAAALGLPTFAPPFLVAELFDVLFSPSALLTQELSALRARVGGLEERQFIAIHLRTGDVAWDPARHGTSELGAFLQCAQDVEEELGLPAETTPWLLATDSAEVARVAAEMPEAVSGKLRIPSAAGRIHIERSEFGDVIDGAASNYAEWLLFSQAAAVVLSRSFFGETAAEIGRVRHAFFAPGGACVRTDLSSS